MSGHESIWLEPEDGSDPDTGRMWCQHPAPGLHDDRTWTEYVRADLVAAREAAAAEEMRVECCQIAASEADEWRRAGIKQCADAVTEVRNLMLAIPARTAAALRAMAEGAGDE